MSDEWEEEAPLAEFEEGDGEDEVPALSAEAFLAVRIPWTTRQNTSTRNMVWKMDKLPIFLIF